MHGTGRVSIYSSSFHLLSYDIFIEILIVTSLHEMGPCVSSKRNAPFDKTTFL